MATRKKKSHKRPSIGWKLATIYIAAVLLFTLYLAISADGTPPSLEGFAQGLESLVQTQSSPGPAQSPLQSAAASSAAPSSRPSPSPLTGESGVLEVYVLDVGQGDSIFLRSPGGKTMLVDAGESSAFPSIDAFLQEQGVERLDIVVATHPHADHIGGMAKIIEKYQIGCFCMPEKSHTSKTFENMLDALLAKEVPVLYGAAGAEEPGSLSWDDAVKVQILSPIAGESYTDLNDFSLVLRISYGTDSILLTGDAESYAEALMLSHFSADELQAELLKMGHHGSSTSSSEDFLNAVSPEAVLISCGENNDYGHPHAETLRAIESHGFSAYRTDINGTIGIRLTGSGYRVSTER